LCIHQATPCKPTDYAGSTLQDHVGRTPTLRSQAQG
jgi:hypothetical protein